jgi:CheY-like chemotaxis protein
MHPPWGSPVDPQRFTLAAFSTLPDDGTHRPGEPAAASKEGLLACVLVVDDDAEVRGYLRTCLAPLTQHILEAGDGEEALHLARHTPDLTLVISDVIMPRMDGVALRAALHADPVLAHVPVLLISGDATLSGAVLKKPFNARTLHASIRSLLSS